MISRGSGPNDRPLPTINRSALVVEPTEVYLEWAKRIPDGNEEWTLDDICGELSVYLIPDIATDTETWLKANYAAIFDEELVGWCQDATFFPEDRSFESFQRFFRVRFHSMVYDMGKDAIERDSE